MQEKHCSVTRCPGQPLPGYSRCMRHAIHRYASRYGLLDQPGYKKASDSFLYVMTVRWEDMRAGKPVPSAVTATEVFFVGKRSLHPMWRDVLTHVVEAIDDVIRKGINDSNHDSGSAQG